MKVSPELETLLAARITAGSPAPVDSASIRLWCAAAEDAHPRHWKDDDDPGLVAPPAMAGVWTRSAPWTPGGAPVRALELHYRLKAALETPIAVVREVSSWFGVPVRVGDRVHALHRIAGLGPWRRSSLGEGRDWSVEVVYRNQLNELVAVETWSFHGFRPLPGDAAPAKKAAPDGERTGDAFPDLTVDVDTSRIVIAAAASRDWTRFHHDPAAAAESGLRDIILNTPGHAALISRWVTENVAPGGRLLRMSLRLRTSVFPGDRLHVGGEKTGERKIAGGRLLELNVTERVGETLTGTGRVAVFAADDPWGLPYGQWHTLADPGIPLLSL